MNIYDTHDPYDCKKVGEAIYYGQSVTEYCPESTASIAYNDFAKEMINHEEG